MLVIPEILERFPDISEILEILEIPKMEEMLEMEWVVKNWKMLPSPASTIPWSEN